VKIVRFDPALSTLEGGSMRRKMKTITVRVTAKQYAKLVKGLKAAQKDVPSLKTVGELVQFWIATELAD
jgi:hypothetical protein